MKEQKLTILVPIIGDEDFVKYVRVHPTVANTVENMIYGYLGQYYRRRGDTVAVVKDVEFPSMTSPFEISEFTYEAVRMGDAPTITATAKWYPTENDGTLYNLEKDWRRDCHVVFGGDEYYLKRIPSSSKKNNDARYVYDLIFVSKWETLERVKLYNVVSPYISERSLNESETFSFFGDVTELRKRINASLVRSGVSSYRKRNGVTTFFSYKEWNGIPLGATEDPTGRYEAYHGDYTAYLQGDVYEYADGEFVIDGFQIVIDNDVVSEQKMIEFDNVFVKDALGVISDRENGFGLTYYYKHGTDSVHIGDCQHDFGEDAPVEYGRYKSLIGVSKENNTEKTVNRMTGRGSSENIPYYYPNPTPDGWIKSVYHTSALVDIPTVSDAEENFVYPSSAANAYEKFLKNRLGHKFVYGKKVEMLFAQEYMDGNAGFGTIDGNDVLFANYRISTDGVVSPGLNLYHAVGLRNTVTGEKLRVRMTIFGGTGDDFISDTYDSAQSYASPTPFQAMCMAENEDAKMSLAADTVYDISITVYVESVPDAVNADYEGYFFPEYTWVNEHGNTAVIAEDFYDTLNLIPSSRSNESHTAVADAGYIYHVDNSPTGGYSYKFPMERHKGKTYKDLRTGTVYKCIKSEASYYYNGHLTNRNAYDDDAVKMSAEEWIDLYLTFHITIYEYNGWYKNGVGSPVNLSDYGMSIEGTPNRDDYITFERVKYLTPQSTLMPELYIKTDGERRFYNAVNYPFRSVSIDEDAGEKYEAGTLNVNNDLYKDENGEYYKFNEPFSENLISEEIEEFEDIKPTLLGMTNTVNGTTFRIDVAADFAYDIYDDDSVWETSDEDGNINGDYKHPHFFMKLRRLPFNLFDLALTEDMQINMVTGHCGSCKFKIKVDEKTKKNPVQIWTFDVYEKKQIVQAGQDPYVLFASAGDLKRYMTAKTLYRRTGVHHIPTEDGRYRTVYDYRKINPDYLTTRNFYSGEDIMAGRVGTLNTEGLDHMEGDVVTSGKFQDEQQDTSAGEVWVALEKDADTYGMLMPSAHPAYGDTTYSLYVRPQSVADTDDEDAADTFTITNIRFPQAYLRQAERDLSAAIVKRMEETNSQKFNFSVDMSRIFLAENESFLANLNENSVLYVRYNGSLYKQYVKSYSYKENGEALPEIKVEMNEDLSAVYGGFSARKAFRRRIQPYITAIRSDIVGIAKEDAQRRYVGRTGTNVVMGTVVSKTTGKTLEQTGRQSLQTANDVYRNKISISIAGDDVERIDTDVERIETSCENNFSVIRNTIEYRFATEESCGTNTTEKVTTKDDVMELFWLNSSGLVITHDPDRCALDVWEHVTTT